jgi:hypothetical protein
LPEIGSSIALGFDRHNAIYYHDINHVAAYYYDYNTSTNNYDDDHRTPDDHHDHHSAAHVRDGRGVRGGRPRPGWWPRVLCASGRGNVRLAGIGLRLQLQVSRGRTEQPFK